MSASPSRSLPCALALAIGIALAGPAAASPLLAAEAAEPAPLPAPRIEVAFLLDTTGSMSGLIEGAKRKIWSIANQMAGGSPTPEIRIGLVAYRDRGDDYVTRVFELTDDLDAIWAALQSLGAAGGGDTPESVNAALAAAVDRLDWTPGQEVYKVVFLVGDAPPHMDYADDVPWTRSVELARARGLVVNTVQCGGMDATADVWREIAASGTGRYVAIRQDGGMLALATPHDEELAQLNRAVGDTWIAWGAPAERAELEAKRERALAAAPSEAASRLAYLAKSGGRANSGRADLLDALESGRVDLDGLPAEVLAEPLRALAPEERRAFVETQRARRRALMERVARLSRERDAYVAAEQARRAAAGEGDGFDQQVLETIRTQAAEKGIAY